VIAVAPS